MNNEQNINGFNVSHAIEKPMVAAVFSQDYLDWVKQANLLPLTNTQHKFAEWLLFEDNAKVISQIGDLDTIFYSVRKWVKKRQETLRYSYVSTNLISKTLSPLSFTKFKTQQNEYTK